MSTNNRASLLAGLRTGGVRSTSGAVPQTAAPTVTSFPRQEMPMTAAVGGSFNQMYAQAQAQAQAQAFQMQMMQMEIMRLQVSSRFLKQVRRLSRSEGLITTLQISFLLPILVHCYSLLFTLRLSSKHNKHSSINWSWHVSRVRRPRTVVPLMRRSRKVLDPQLLPLWLAALLRRNN